MGKFNEINEKIGNYRWTICALVFFATTINYLDRNVLGLLKSTLEVEMQWSETDFSHIVMAFQLAYALGLLGIGRVIDKTGTKAGYFLSLLGWSIAAMVHGLARNTFSFGAARAFLGVTEAGNFPAANKAIAEWFPKKERAFATGIYNSGANIGSIVAPLCVPWIAVNWGWEWAFVATGAIGLVWLAFWWFTYKSPAEKLKEGKLKQAEYDFIHSDRDEQQSKNSAAEHASKQIKWIKLLTYRQTWSFFFGKFLTDPVWWFYLFWLPGFLNGDNKAKLLAAYPNGLPDGVSLETALNETTKFSNMFSNSEILDKLQDVSLIIWPVAVAVVYTISTVGSVFGGWLPKYFVNRGKTVYTARMTSMLIYALLPLSVLAAQYVGQINTWYAVLLIGLACAGHQAWSANIFTTVSDMFPKKAVASVTGIGGMAGAFGGMLIAWSAGLLLDHFKLLNRIETGYGILFAVCALAYIVAWVVMKILVPKFKIVTDL
ncbi:MAG: MFS transporter [Prevotellaceae bacterium]|jgi:ACS family hexuronate transporter-like MFS transporter|nr:MFS transporter [Prevotellaceae bacterium]